METESHYARLPGRGGLFVLHRTYVAEDHLLVVQTNLFLERYRRLYFRDLESFTIQRNNRAVAWGISSGIVASLCGLLAWLLWHRATDAGPSGGVVFWGFLAVTGVAVFVWNLVLGAGCSCRAQTAVQTVELRSLSRWRQAQRVRGMLLERVAAAQGAVASPPSASEQGTSVGGGSVPFVAGPAISHAQPPPQVSVTLHPSAVRAVAVTALCSLLAAAGVAIDYLQTGSWAVVLMLCSVLAALAAVITQLVIGRSARSPRSARNVAWGVIGVTVLGGIAAYVCMMAMIFRNLGKPPNFFDFMLEVWRLAPGEDRLVDVSYLTISVLYLVVAVMAVLVWWRLDAARRAAAVVAAP